MARKKLSETAKDSNLTLNDADMVTKRVYGRRTVLRAFGAALLGAGAIIASTDNARSADTDKRELGDGKDRFADAKMSDPKTPAQPKTKDTDKRELGDGNDRFADSKMSDPK